jgi:flagellar basal body-associated protein FliL
MEGEIQINIPQEICQDTSKFNNNKSEKNSSIIFILIIPVCLILTIVCIYILFSNNPRSLSSKFHLPKYFNRNRRRESPNSYHQLTQESNNEMRKIIVKYNSTTQQTQPYLDTDKSDFIHEQNITLKLNTNPINDVEDNTL